MSQLSPLSPCLCSLDTCKIACWRVLTSSRPQHPSRWRLRYASRLSSLPDYLALTEQWAVRECWLSLLSPYLHHSRHRQQQCHNNEGTHADTSLHQPVTAGRSQTPARPYWTLGCVIPCPLTGILTISHWTSLIFINTKHTARHFILPA